MYVINSNVTKAINLEMSIVVPVLSLNNTALYDTSNYLKIFLIHYGYCNKLTVCYMHFITLLMFYFLYYVII